MITVDQVMAWENGEMEDDAILEMFAEMIRDGTAWEFQGCYGRFAMQLIQGGYISTRGEILKRAGE